MGISWWVLKEQLCSNCKLPGWFPTCDWQLFFAPPKGDTFILEGPVFFKKKKTKHLQKSIINAHITLWLKHMVLCQGGFTANLSFQFSLGL
jgi:hypothetical protein